MLIVVSVYKLSHSQLRREGLGMRLGYCMFTIPTRVCIYVTIKHVHTVSFPAQEVGCGNETRACLESGTIPQWHAVLRRAKPCGWWRPPGSWGRSPRLGSC